MTKYLEPPGAAILFFGGFLRISFFTSLKKQGASRKSVLSLPSHSDPVGTIPVRGAGGTLPLWESGGSVRKNRMREYVHKILLGTIPGC